MFIVGLFTMVKTWKQPVSISRWMGKEVVVQWNIIQLSKKHPKEILLFATAWVNVEGIMLSVINLTEKDKTVWSHLYVTSISKKQNTKLIEKDKICGYKRWQVRGCGVVDVLEEGGQRHILPVIR